MSVARDRRRRWVSWLALVLSWIGPTTVVQAQTEELGKGDRRRLQFTLNNVVREVRENYYDATFGGRDLDEMAKTTRQRIDAARDIGEALSAIAQFTLEFDDSHTFFLPPFLTVDSDYGWDVGIVGERGMVLEVKPGSDAEKQGIRRGDVVKTINGFPVSRKTLWKIDYLFRGLRPQPGLRVELVTPEGLERELHVAAKVEARRQLLELDSGFGWARMQDEYNVDRRKRRLVRATVGDKVLVARFKQFTPADDEPERLLEAARDHNALILDLRENGGGQVSVLKQIVGGLFAEDTIVATFKDREKSDPILAKGSKGKAFTGKVWILVSAQSASASELLARTVQLKGRGQVVGDRSAGSVRVSRTHDSSVKHGDFVVASGVRVTVADVVMPDGQPLEKVGVIPDVQVLPTPYDLAAGRDPVLAKVLELAGVSMDATAAGKLLEPAIRSD